MIKDYFDTEFMSEDEINEIGDAIVLNVMEAIKKQDNKTSIVNPEKVKDISRVYRLLKKATENTKTKVSYTLHEPLRNVGIVSLQGAKLKFNDPRCLCAASKLASNFEVYPRTDGVVQINFTFYGLTIPIE